jgi:hypothetical protein
MAKRLPDDFRDFLKLCNQKRVRYLLICGYAVGCHGFPRATDINLRDLKKNKKAAGRPKDLDDLEHL